MCICFDFHQKRQSLLTPCRYIYIYICLFVYFWNVCKVYLIIHCMSPVLSNIFQNDMHDIFSQDECDPVRLYDIYINSISWADDLLILSHSRKGLQTCLDKLHAYCSKWGLVVNQTKTKTMVFSKNKWQPEKFYYWNSEIECVKEIQYIGFNITHNMNNKTG